MAMRSGGAAWIYDWNVGRGTPRPAKSFELNDETLRDGLQSPSVLHPPIGTKIEILHLMAELAIESANIGYPGASQRAVDDVVALAQEISRGRLAIRPNCAGRTTEADIIPIAKAQDRAGVAIDAALFIGSSPIRQYAEGWDITFLLKTIDQAVTLARRLGLEVMFVTEDTTRARPAHLRQLYTTAIRCGARRICLADTVGHVTPWGVKRLVRFMRRVADETGAGVKIDWHGHRDRGLDVLNSLAAIEAGVDRVHACALGIGERVGNTSMDLLLVNLKLLGWRDQDLSALPRYCETVAKAVGIPIPANYPVLGKDAFETSTGVHAAAILKAFKKGDHWLANRVYSGVPAEEVGRQQAISIGPMSGQANVLFWLQRQQIEPTPELIDTILNAAKRSNRVLRDDEILALIATSRPSERAQPEADRTAPLLLLSGDEAVARGAYEAGVHVATGYPGTPSTEIVEALARFPDVDVQWSVNEKVALDVALGAAFGGGRALAAMKHVGLNVAADTLMTSAYTGVGGALVVVSADDPGMHSSQNEQDNRLYGKFAGIPVLEPSDSEEARVLTKLAFELSARYDVPVLLRITTRIAHTRTPVTVEERQTTTPTGFISNPTKYVMLPAYARGRHPTVLDRLAQIAASADPRFVTTQWRSGSIGVITSGVAYHYVREVLPDASVLKLNLTYPVPLAAVRAFASQVERLFVVEELEPFLEEILRANGINVSGKAFWPQVGELTPGQVRAGFVAAGVMDGTTGVRGSGLGVRTGSVSDTEPRTPHLVSSLMPRPPVLCPGCPHVMPLLAFRKLGAVVCGDIGCYTLAALEPLRAMDTCVAMGCSIGMAAGMAKTRPDRPVVAAIGDSTFLHAGIPALLDAVYNRAHITVLILNNGTTAMTGGQPHPGTGHNVRGEAAPAIDLAALCRSMGVEQVVIVDPYDVAATYLAAEQAVARDSVSVLITNRPCVEAPVKIRDIPFFVVPDACTACQLCMNLGCPSITWIDELYEGRPKVTIDGTTCTGCTVCAQVCPADAIRPTTVKVRAR